VNRWVEIWLLYGATCSAGGWILSWLQLLNPAGYLSLHALFLVAVGWRYRVNLSSRPNPAAKLKRRFFPRKLSREKHLSYRRFLPFSFFILASLSLLAGLLYAPNNYDALAYRIPRVMHWLQNEGWHWIHTSCPRMNNRATGFEWLMAPQLSLWQTDRFLFLISYVPFLLMPGLIFSTIRETGGSGRGAWFWVWLLPTGYGYLLQAASIANDGFATAYALAAVAYSLRFCRLGDSPSLFFALLSTALLSGVKTSNIILALAPLAILLVARKKLWIKGGLVLGCGLVFFPVSFFPTAYLNWRFCGDWSGAVLESSRFASSSWVGWAGNSLQLLVHNLAPPILPGARAWDEWLQSCLPGWIAHPISQDFEGGFSFGLGEIPTEGSGLGLGLSLCLLAVIWLSRACFRPLWLGSTWPQRVAFVSGPLVLAILMSKSAILTFYRICLPFYPVVLLFFLAATLWGKIRKSVFLPWLVLGQMTLAALALVLEPSRPLFPATTIFSQTPPWGSLAPYWERAHSVYQGYRARHAVFASIRSQLPVDTRAVGFMNGGDDPVGTLWKPYGTLEVIEITPQDELPDLQTKAVRYCVAGERGVRELANMELHEWVARLQGEIVSEFQIAPAVSRGQERWVLIKLPPAHPSP
jgi:hypothetical protein